MGHLTVIMGCMFAQKTTELLRYVRRYKSIGHRVLTINSHRDTRYGNSGEIVSHDDGREQALHMEQLSEADEDVRSGEYQVVVIDEGQFFTDLFTYVTKWADECPIHIVVAGLDGTFERDPFGQMLWLIPHAEEVLRLSALCAMCCDGTKGIYSKRIPIKTELSSDVVLVGGSDSYQPVCRKHYLES